MDIFKSYLTLTFKNVDTGMGERERISIYHFLPPNLNRAIMVGALATRVGALVVPHGAYKTMTCYL